MNVSDRIPREYYTYSTSIPRSYALLTAEYTRRKL